MTSRSVKSDKAEHGMSTEKKTNITYPMTQTNTKAQIHTHMGYKTYTENREELTSRIAGMTHLETLSAGHATSIA